MDLHLLLKVILWSLLVIAAILILRVVILKQGLRALVYPGILAAGSIIALLIWVY